MFSYHITPKMPLTQSLEKITVVGLGGAGCQVVDLLTFQRVQGMELVAVHSTLKSLQHVMTPKKVLLGEKMSFGIGAGGDLDLAKELALDSREQIKASIDGSDLVLIGMGLGGVTSLGSLGVVVEEAKKLGAKVIAIASMPMSFEGKAKKTFAKKAVKELKATCDSVLLFDNNKISEKTLQDSGILEVFASSDKLMASAIRFITTLLSCNSTIALGIDDINLALSSKNGRCLFGSGEASGEGRTLKALEQALNSPLAGAKDLLSQTEHLIVHIAGGKEVTIFEVDQLMQELQRLVPSELKIKLGVSVLAEQFDSVTVTLLSSLDVTKFGFETEQDEVAPLTEVVVQQDSLELVGNQLPLKEDIAAAALVSPSVADWLSVDFEASQQKEVSSSKLPVVTPVETVVATTPPIISQVENEQEINFLLEEEIEEIAEVATPVEVKTAIETKVASAVEAKNEVLNEKDSVVEESIDVAAPIKTLEVPIFNALSPAGHLDHNITVDSAKASTEFDVKVEPVKINVDELVLPIVKVVEPLSMPVHEMVQTEQKQDKVEKSVDNIDHLLIKKQSHFDLLNSTQDPSINLSSLTPKKSELPNVELLEIGETAAEVDLDKEREKFDENRESILTKIDDLLPNKALPSKYMTDHDMAKDLFSAAPATKIPSIFAAELDAAAVQEPIVREIKISKPEFVLPAAAPIALPVHLKIGDLNPALPVMVTAVNLDDSHQAKTKLLDNQNAATKLLDLGLQESSKDSAPIPVTSKSLQSSILSKPAAVKEVLNSMSLDSSVNVDTSLFTSSPIAPLRINTASQQVRIEQNAKIIKSFEPLSLDQLPKLKDSSPVPPSRAVSESQKIRLEQEFKKIPQVNLSAMPTSRAKTESQMVALESFEKAKSMLNSTSSSRLSESFPIPSIPLVNKPLKAVDSKAISLNAMKSTGDDLRVVSDQTPIKSEPQLMVGLSNVPLGTMKLNPSELLRANSLNRASDIQIKYSNSFPIDVKLENLVNFDLAPAAPLAPAKSATGLNFVDTKKEAPSPVPHGTMKMPVVSNTPVAPNALGQKQPSHRTEKIVLRPKDPSKAYTPVMSSRNSDLLTPSTNPALASSSPINLGAAPPPQYPSFSPAAPAVPAKPPQNVMPNQGMIAPPVFQMPPGFNSPVLPPQGVNPIAAQMSGDPPPPFPAFSMPPQPTGVSAKLPSARSALPQFSLPAAPSITPNLPIANPVMPESVRPLPSAPMPSPVAAPAPPMGNAPRAPRAMPPQPSAVQAEMNLGADRGRFNETTENKASSGDDLDIPTWKRLKMKLGIKS